MGPQRTYHIVQRLPQDLDKLSYPPRPISGSIADLDIIRDQCSFANGKVGHLVFLFRGQDLKPVSSSVIALNFCELVQAWTTEDEYDEENWTKTDIYTRRKYLTREIYTLSILLPPCFLPHFRLDGMALTQVYRRKGVLHGSLPWTFPHHGVISHTTTL